MTPQEFIAKWQRANLSERSAYQQHFLDLCDVLGQPKPAAADPDGAWYTFERGVKKTEGGKGWADVWMRGHFGWEYKGKHKDLAGAYRQLLLYREDLENPPLLVVCDLDRFEIHTNFTGTVKQVHAFDLAGLAQPANLDALRKLFSQPEALRPGRTAVGITEEASEQLAMLADGLRNRDVAAPEAAHFLMKLMFCMFAEDIGLLPDGLFSRLVEASRFRPERLSQLLKGLFEAMARGGLFGADEILHFNGGLFADSDVVDLLAGEIETLARVTRFEWNEVEPSIFGTLFERTLDPSKRAQIGAHYTSRRDIETLLEPVMMAPLRRRWDEVRAECESLVPRIRAEARAAAARKSPARRESKPRRRFDRLLQDFVEELSHVSVLDPACGSGNFLYVAIHMLLELEKQVIAFAASNDLSLVSQVRPTQLLGIEINPYAQQLAQVVIWIGYLQWMKENGFPAPRNPVLEPIESIRAMDAIVDLADPQHPREPDWPDADFIVGNPPFLGGKLLRTNLGDEYVDAIFRVWDERVPREADLCCYWFEKARSMIERQRCKRAGLLATQGIRGGANRKVLERIKASGDIFFAESDREWVLDGANVHVSMVGFDKKLETVRLLDGQRVMEIGPTLSVIVSLHHGKPIRANRGLVFMGVTKQGPFDISAETAEEWLHCVNPHRRPNSDVLRMYLNGMDVTKRSRGWYLIDFPHGMPIETAAAYEKPFQYVEEHVRPFREARQRDWFRDQWWEIYARRPELRAALEGKQRYIVTPRVSKHRLFTWLDTTSLPDCQLFAFARDDDYFFGVLHSRVHEVWARAQGTQVRERESGFRYTPTTCFETFPLPVASDAEGEEIAAAARHLDTLRCNWLNPPEWTRTQILEFPGSVDGPWARYVQGPVERGIGTVRYPRLVPKDEDSAGRLKTRTLTNLYNDRPTWLALAHQKLDAAVLAAYGWPTDTSDDDLLTRLLALNLERAGDAATG